MPHIFYLDQIMKEQEILQEILQDAKIGWWRADMTHRVFYLSDMVQQFLRLSDNEIAFDDFRRMVSPPYREYAFAEDALGRGSFPVERTYPLYINGREYWFYIKTLRDEVTDDGVHMLTGYARQVEPQGRVDDFPVETERVNDLLYRLNTISHTLLSLQHTDLVDETVKKILGDLLTVFHGDRAYIIEFDWKRRMHVSRFEVTASGVSAEGEFINQFEIDNLPWWTEAVSQGQPIILTTLDDLPAEAIREREVLEAQDVKSLLVMPLTSQDKVWGYAGIDIVERVRHWSDVDCQWFSSLINIISLCLSLQRSEQYAHSERQYLKSLYEHMPLGYARMRVLYDAQGEVCDYRVLDANAATDKIAGASRKDYVGCTGSQLGQNLEEYLPRLAEVLRTNSYLEIDSQIAGKHYIHSILYTTRPDEVICLISDTTEVLKAHEALYRNEELLRNIFDNIQIGVELYDVNGKLVDINNKDMEIFGVVKKEDVMGVSFYENPNVPLETRQAVREGRNQAFRLNYPFEQLGAYYSSAKTGFIEIFTTVNMLYDMEGNRVNFMLINIDNTEINRAHSRLAEFESSFSLVCRYGQVGYCRFDLLSKQGYGVPQWFHNIGEKEDTPLDQVIGIYSHVDPADRDAILACIQRIRNAEIDSFSLDLRVNPGCDDEKWTRVNVVRNSLNNDPSKIEMVCVNYDITELKKTELNLVEAKNKAEISDRLKSAFLANMSHEIRTPLNAIVGFSNLLAETENIDERREFMQVVEDNNDLLLKLISDILDLSKIEAGTFEFEYSVVDVVQMCEEAVLALGLKVAGRPIDLRFDQHEPHRFISGDKNRLMQVITNFINNALKFTQQGHVILDYRVVGDQIRIQVADTGTGISPEQQATVFERFVKLNNFAQGTGLGLSICKSIVEQMGGQIGVESEVGLGSCFWFTVPIGTYDLATLQGS